MIKSFKHKGLRQFFEKGSTAGINTQQIGKIRLRLGVIDAAKDISVSTALAINFTHCRVSVLGSGQ